MLESKEKSELDPGEVTSINMEWILTCLEKLNLHSSRDMDTECQNVFKNQSKKEDNIIRNKYKNGSLLKAIDARKEKSKLRTGE